MQLVFDFSQWLISPRQGVVGRQYDNLSHSLVVEGELPSGYTWDMLVEAKGKYNIIPLSATATGATASLTADQLAFGNTYYAFQLRGTSGDVIHHTNAVQVYVPDTIVGPGTWPVLPTEISQAEANIKELNAHPPVPGENGYWMLWDLDTHSYVQSQLVVPGLHIEIGETTTGEPGTPANVTNSGTNTAPVLNFTIPEGEKGDAATIQVGTVTASDPGSEPQVKNSGTENAAVFDFVLPTGQTGPTGQAATIEVESTVTGEPGTQANVENVGTTGAAKLKFTIPIGNTGQNGVTPTLSAGDVETLEPGQPATASVTGEGPAYQINLGIPRGQTGQTGATPALEIGQVETLEPGQPATAEFSGTPEKPVLSLGIPQGQPGQDGVQLNDSAINTTEAWSSKKIVDTLCPAFTVEGNPVTCQPVEGYPLGVKVSFSPRQEGEGDPSPENVRPISGRTSVEVTRCGKNLLVPNDVSSVEVYGVTISRNNNQYTVKGTSTGSGGRLNKLGEFGLAPGTYVISVNEGAGASQSISAYLTDKDAGEVVVGSGKYATFTLDKFTNVIFGFNLSDGIYYDTTLVVQLELGYTPTAYEPYQGSTTTLAMPETIYGGEVDAVSGVGSKTWGYIASYNGESLPGEWISDRDVYAAGTTPTTGAQVAYKLATPEPFQASGNQALPAVAGLNTVYTDGDSLTVTGRRDLVSALEDLQTTMTAVTTLISEGGLT